MSKKINRNAPCPCGSGKKYKQCCLKNETVKTYTPSGKRKFKAKVLTSGGSNLLSKLAPQASSGKEFKATSGAPKAGGKKEFKATSGASKAKDEFVPTDASFEEKTEKKIETTEPIKTPKFKKIPSKQPGDTFNPTDQDFRVDEK